MPLQRFRRAERLNTSWDHPEDATQYGNACPQGTLVNEQNYEDCLNINVIAPAGTKPGDDLPVFLWIFGVAPASQSLANQIRGSLCITRRLRRRLQHLTDREWHVHRPAVSRNGQAHALRFDKLQSPCMGLHGQRRAAI